MNDRFRNAAAAVLISLWTLPAGAAPGAHGPGGEHLDQPGTAASGSGAPRMEASSEAFELVATLHDGELSILIDRYDTNEPVLQAMLEVESGGHKAKATFHADHGDYAVDDKALLATLARPGEHALVFTLLAGKESDLLDGMLRVRAAAAGGDHGHAHDGDGDPHHGLERAGWTGAAIGLLGLIGAAAWWRRRRSSSVPGGVQQ